MTKTQPPADDLVKRLLYCHAHGIFDAAEAGKSASFAEAAAKLTSLRAMCDELAGAVEPFAKVVADDEGWEIGDLRTVNFDRARAAYAKYQQEQGR